MRPKVPAGAAGVKPARRAWVYAPGSRHRRCGAGGQYVVDQRQVQALDRGAGGQGKGVPQVASARPGVQFLLGDGVLNTQQTVFISRNLQAFAQPVHQHRGLVVAALALPFHRHGHGQQQVRAGQAVVETFAQGQGQQFAQQAPQRPLALVFEAGDQAVDREVVGPGRDDLFKAGRSFQALATGQAGHRQGQGAGLAVVQQPGQFTFAGRAEWMGVVAGFVAEQTDLVAF